MDFKLIKDLISTIKQQVKCGNCRKRFVYRELDLKDISDTNLTIACNCSKCGNTSFLELDLKMPKDFATKRKPQNLKISARKQKQITQNDVLDMKNFLKDFTGDFKEIFNN